MLCHCDCCHSGTLRYYLVSCSILESSLMDASLKMDNSSHWFFKFYFEFRSFCIFIEHFNIAIANNRVEHGVTQKRVCHSVACKPTCKTHEINTTPLGCICMSENSFNFIAISGRKSIILNCHFGPWLLGRIFIAATRSPPCGGGVKSQYWRYIALRGVFFFYSLICNCAISYWKTFFFNSNDQIKSRGKRSLTKFLGDSWFVSFFKKWKMKPHWNPNPMK